MNISKSKFLKTLELVLNSTIFSFNDKFYKQTFDVSVGLPLSPIVSDIVMQDLEMKVLQRLSITPSFYVRYVDDIALAYHMMRHPLIHW